MSAETTSSQNKYILPRSVHKYGENGHKKSSRNLRYSPDTAMNESCPSMVCKIRVASKFLLVRFNADAVDLST